MSKTLALTKTLVEKPSVTPDDQGCQALMIDRLTAIGFQCQTLRFGDVDNFWATWGDSGPLLCFAGHTDVVPTGPESSWRFPPFEATEDGGFLFGRGTADMKASLAAMITACEAYAEKHQNPPKGRIGFLITSDEEGPSINGTVKVMEWLADNKIRIDYCLVGEPSSTQKLGDVIKNGRRGSLGCKLRIKGVQGHIAYPHLAKNPVHLVAPFLTELTTTHWDNGNDYFPATSCQISNINGGTGATNVIPGHLDILFNFRYSTELTAEAIQARVQTMLDKHELNVDIEWNLSGKPFLTQEAELVKACQASIKAVTGIETALSTSGGTSDGRFIAPYGVQVVELGPINATIHKIDECVAIDDLEPLSNIYLGIMETLTL